MLIVSPKYLGLGKNNEDKYKGEFKNDKQEGKGVMIWNNGDKYEGEFKNDKQ